MREQIYSIADHNISVKFADHTIDIVSLAPSFQPFVVNSTYVADIAISVTVDNDYRPDRDAVTEVDRFFSSDLEYFLYAREDGGFIVSFRDKARNPLGIIDLSSDFRSAVVALLTNGDNVVMSSYAFSTAMMLAYTFATANLSTLVIHSSVVKHKGKGFLFLGKSGTGKSTHSQLWLKNISDAELINDDNPIIRIKDTDNIMVYGSPWSGKTPCYKSIKAPIGALVGLHQSGKNKILRLQPVSAFVEILSSVATLICCRPCYDSIVKTVIRLSETIPFYSLECLPDDEAARLCAETVSR